MEVISLVLNRQKQFVRMAPTGGRRGNTCASVSTVAIPTPRTRKKFKRSAQLDDGIGNNHTGNRIRNQNIFNQLNDNEDQSESDEEYARKKPRSTLPKPPPPITIQSHTISQLKPALETIKDVNIKEIKYKICQTGVKIYTPNITVFNVVKKFCEDSKMHGFTHTAADDRSVKVCLYGLWPMKTEDLMNELKTVGVVPTDIKQLTLSNPRYTDQTIYLVYFQRKQHITVDELKTKAEGLFNIIVDWRYYKNRSKEPTQCENCLQFGHGKLNCFGKSPVCFRCAGPHPGSGCPFLVKPANENERPRIDDNLVKCALCDKKGHTATDRNCESRRKFKDIQTSLKSRSQPPVRNSPRPNIKSTREFPAPPQSTSRHPLSTATHVFTPAPPPASPAWVNNVPTQRQWENNGRNQRRSDLLSTDQCMEMFDYFVSELLKCRTKAEQIRTIAKISLEQVSKYLTPNLNDDVP